VTVTLSLALPFKTWLAQRDQISSLAAHNTVVRHEVANLQRLRQEWRDPAYIEKQAQVRLHYVMPGQTEYVVLGGGHKHAASKPHLAPTDKPWYSQLWDSAQATGT